MDGPYEVLLRERDAALEGTTQGLLKFPMALMDPIKRVIRHSTRKAAGHNKEEETPVAGAAFGFNQVKAENVFPSTPSSLKQRLDEAIESVSNVLPNVSDMPTYTFVSSPTSADSHHISSSPEGSGAGEPHPELRASSINEESLYQTYLAKYLGDCSFESRITNNEPNLDTGLRLLTKALIDPRLFNLTAWCYDTPGLLASDQMLNYLSPAQLSHLQKIEGSTFDRRFKDTVHAKNLLIPRTFVLQSGLSLLLGRLGRIDVI
ncbi:unnamed protein product, partial [Protopolystoma xenopodis]